MEDLRMNGFNRRGYRVVLLATALACAAPITAHAAIEIKAISNRADLISGGDALVEVVLPPGLSINPAYIPAAIKASVDGTLLPTGTFAPLSDGRVFGLVKGLKDGPNILTVSTPSGAAHLTITNHPKGGPIFAGPQVQPWVCMTAENGLGPPIDPQCNAPTKVEYFYRSTDPTKNTTDPTKSSFLPYDPSSPPTDVATTTTDQGITVPFIVRRERGTLDRFVYEITVLTDPTKQVSPFNPPPAWNGKLYYQFFGGAAPQHTQASVEPFGIPMSFANQPADVVSVATALSLGFAVADSSGNVFNNNANSVTSAEVMMMVKERVVETLGEIRYTLSQGASGGSMQQHLIANAYPGLLDGIMPAASFQDIYTTNNEVQDCSLLARYFDANSGLWSDVTQQNAVWENANQSPGTCRAWGSFPPTWMDPTVGCFATPQPWMYNPVTNPTGARCTLQDYQVAMFGRRSDGFANRPYDNVGLQYGLKALQAGKITAEQFVHMNEHVGGRDIDWNWTPQRSVADPVGLEVAYRSGQVNLGTGLSAVPVIDLRVCNNLEIHSCFHSWVMRQRLLETNGNADNHVILFPAAAPGGAPYVPDTVAGPAMAQEALTLLDRWVAAIKADTSNDSQALKVARHRPPEAQDACWISGVRTTDMAACQAAFPRFGDPRTGAGEPLPVDVMKCQLKPLVRTSYPVMFSDAQWSRLQATFPSGVCDWNEESVGFQLPVPWLSYADGPGGKPLGSEPKSTPGF
jgi:hypothetical protein